MITDHHVQLIQYDMVQNMYDICLQSCWMVLVSPLFLLKMIFLILKTLTSGGSQQRILPIKRSKHIAFLVVLVWMNMMNSWIWNDGMDFEPFLQQQASHWCLQTPGSSKPPDPGSRDRCLHPWQPHPHFVHGTHQIRSRQCWIWTGTSSADSWTLGQQNLPSPVNKISITEAHEENLTTF